MSTDSARPAGGKERQRVATFCRICEPMCGVMATVEDGQLTGIGPTG
ncbi:MAG: hypothetical protein OXQ89_11815 [Rhodospirillaceae bacterium]|nr:hypothetical protein [Rhodospirillaceae bacterium]